MMMFLQLTLLTLLIASPGSLIHAENVITCGRNVQHLACARGVIQVHSAFYGRSSSAICRANRHPARLANIWCRSTIGAIPARCNGKKWCKFNANIVGRFDPCPGTSKYFSTTYTCVRRHPWRGQPIYRPPFYNPWRGQPIYRPPFYKPWRGQPIYRPAIYKPWRVQPSYWPPFYNPWRVQPIYRPAIYKPWRSRHHVYRRPINKNALACEHSNAVLKCGRHRSIIVLNANYGRTDRRTCTRGRFFFFRFFNRRCYQRNSTFRVINRCNGRRTCQVPASNWFFSDPCFGTYKYLRVSYACV